MQEPRYKMVLLVAGLAIFGTLRAAEASILSPSDALWVEQMAAVETAAQTSTTHPETTLAPFLVARQLLTAPSAFIGRSGGDFGTPTLDSSIGTTTSAFLCTTQRTTTELVVFLRLQPSCLYPLFSSKSPLRPPQVT